jgi:3-dehydroquinate dehydratase-1
MKQKNYQPVVIRQLTLGEGMPKICVPLVAHDQGDIESQIALIQAGPHDLIEWRVDYLEGCTQWETVHRALELIRSRIGETVLLFTFRTRSEGGESDITPREYETLCLEAAGSQMVDLIDVEYHMGEEFVRSLTAKLQEKHITVIGSCHDFAGTPDQDDILHIMRRMQILGVDITKMAVMPQSRADVLTLLGASVRMEEQYANRPFITMSMGKLGSLSRLAGSLDGSALTFAAAGRASAPGQMSADGIRAALDLL